MKKSSKTSLATVISIIAIVMLLFAAGCSSGSSSDDYDYDNTYTEEPEQSVENKTEFENDVSYVMIYNPYIYDDNYSLFGYDSEPDTNELTSGNMASQVNVNLRRAVALEDEDNLKYVSPSDFSFDIDDSEINLSGNRAAPLQETFEEGETSEFWCGFDSRSKETFTCIYAGEHCYVWDYNSGISESQLISCGEKFDEDIYDTDVSLFGEPRFVDNGGKINLLFYPMGYGDNTGMVCGFFLPYEILTSSELSESVAESNGINLNRAILHMNANAVTAFTELDEEDEIYSTMAHEMQHLICSTDWIESASGTYAAHCSTWLNEAMSGFVEEYLYPGVKSTNHGHIKQFMLSDMLRDGQSLYNFATDYDIGVYGSVYLFSEYVANLVGDNAFKSIHSDWRSNSSGTETEARALYDTFPESERNRISSSIAYPSSITFDNEYDEWMSKMTLDFYLSMLTYEDSDPDAYSYIDPMALLYDQTSPAEIEGGGRIIIATNDGSFSIPDDAEDGLIYIGLDENFAPTGEVISK